GGTSGSSGAGGGEALRSDLEVKSIAFVGVTCPGGQGTCVTTLEIAIENIGEGDAPAYNFEVTLDPMQSVVVSQPVPGGIAAGITQLFTIVTPASDNCFDPDCSVSVVVDDLNDVIESDETNNTGDALFPG
ncbi:MAG: CARDB domain-containing protein, partial [Polyangiales bacterium]